MRSQLLANALKILLTVLATMFATESIAAQLNLGGGESAIIQPNTTTTVTCGGGAGGGSCDEAVQAFRSIMTACSNDTSTHYCLQMEWPRFKDVNPSCTYVAAGTCMEYCKRASSSPDYCLNFCR